MEDIQIVRGTASWGRCYFVYKNNKEELALPSVTTVLKLLTEPKYAPLKIEFGEERWQKILDEASFRGTIMHSMLENFLLEYAISRSVDLSLNTAQRIAIEEEKKDPSKRALVKKGRDLFWNFYYDEFWLNIKEVLHNELFLWTDFRGGWAGATDFVFLDFDDFIVVIDFKSSTSIKNEEDVLSYKCQISAYMFAYAERYGVVPDRGEIWIANESNSSIQKFIVTKDEFKIYLRKFLELLAEFQGINNIVLKQNTN